MRAEISLSVDVIVLSSVFVDNSVTFLGAARGLVHEYSNGP